MDKINLDIQNCHGIRNLKETLDFNGKSTIAIYAPNGTMKTSFAKTFSELAASKSSTDEMFPDRNSVRNFTDDTGAEITAEQVVVIFSYDEELGPSDSTSTLLVNSTLRKEYEILQKDLLKATTTLLESVKATAGTRTDVGRLISKSITKMEDNLYVALTRLQEELQKQKEASFKDVPYDTIFNDQVRAITSSADFGSVLNEYVTKLNELLDKSVFFSRGTFSYYNASNVTKSLVDNNYFQANHTLTLKGSDGKDVVVTNSKQFGDLVAEEQAKISADSALRVKLDAMKTKLEKNANTRAFYEFISSHVEILPELQNLDLFEEKLWKSYLKSNETLYTAVITQWRQTEERKAEIEENAASERTIWESVIEIFNDRFFVPFRLVAKNKKMVVLGQESALQLGFEFDDGGERVTVKRDDLLAVLSAGEKKALYILNVLFEVEARKNLGSSTLFIIDDLADSFDYKNKYAIIQYLHEMSMTPKFCQIILTHNFDFFRTLEGRGVANYNNCLTAQKTEQGIQLVKASGIRNPFIRDFKPHFYDDPMKRIASIPFIRNILEYTKGAADPDYLKLTSVLHWKSDSTRISNADLDSIFLKLFGEAGNSVNPIELVVDQVLTQASAALNAPDGINFENKIVLSLAIRLLAEQYMESMIADSAFFDSITSKQTQTLHREFHRKCLGSDKERKILDSVLLMTPENLHVNAFMYEPIIDISDEHLRRLYREVRSLKDSIENSI